MRVAGKLGRSSAGPGRRVAGRVVLVLVATALIAACGGPGGRVSSGNACAAASPAEYLARARVVFVGTMLPGRAASLGGRRILVSPARVRVTRYLKGNGPHVASVATGVSPGNAIGAEGIEPRAGQRWKIYTPSGSGRLPYQTSICDSSKQMR